jgi:hypothetical protein
MKLDWQELNINKVKTKVKVTIKEDGDQKKLRNIFKLWLKLNNVIKTISTRGVNIPEAISENAFCLFLDDYMRVVKLNKGKCSFDCINLKNGKRTQIKASSVSNDLTSFGPRSEFDELFFLDFSRLNGSFDVYKIKLDWIYKFKVNKTQTFLDQQAQSRRPRFSIVKKIIIPKKLKPLYTFQL